ncbi:MAG: hypothetical protein HY578_09855 [Nitrospinae bacterium]|nr:hypothetical protein [Nitrospinota bacterium]
MQTITLADDVLGVVKSSIHLKKRVLQSNYADYKGQLKTFESKYGMSTKQFLNKYNLGQLGDAQKWFDWLFAYEAFSEISRELLLLHKVRL